MVEYEARAQVAVLKQCSAPACDGGAAVHALWLVVADVNDQRAVHVPLYLHHISAQYACTAAHNTLTATLHTRHSSTTVAHAPCPPRIFNSKDVQEACIPSANGLFTARALATLHNDFLLSLGAVDAATAGAATSPAATTVVWRKTLAPLVHSHLYMMPLTFTIPATLLMRRMSTDTSSCRKGFTGITMHRLSPPTAAAGYMIVFWHLECQV
eukprot:TRINITY_DN2479_c0_g1_i2.p1 TRINITY_DN2479_c0_g1~~TRINITY_DN2479_c0_g1_i2.p1  ORF type:complete len:212 (-),score=34.07 TRINITY_DN2479_c0_g1_i2:361-996(-)